MKPRHWIKLVSLPAETMEVSASEFLNDFEEAIFRLRIIILVDEAGNGRPVGVDKQLEALQRAVCRKADFRISKVLDQLCWLNAAKEREAKAGNKEVAATDSSAVI